MILYWSNFIFVFFMMFITLAFDKNIIKILVFFFLIYLILFTGLRHEVGGDWVHYVVFYEKVSNLGIKEVVFYQQNYDLLYVLVNYFAIIFDHKIYGVNLICSILFFLGFYHFLKDKDYPFFLILISLPYIINVVLMGYSRQGVALGFVLWATTYWNNKTLSKYILLIVIGGMFHNTALIFLIFLILKIKDYKKLIYSSALVGIVFALFYPKFVEYYYYFYFGDQNIYSSSGALIRTSMNFFPSVAYILYWKYFSQYKDHLLWFSIAIICVFMPFISIYAPTPVDRMSIYTSIIQLVFFSRIIVLIKHNTFKTVFIIIISLIYLGVNYVFLNYADNIRYWIPYKNILFHN